MAPTVEDTTIVEEEVSLHFLFLLFVRRYQRLIYFYLNLSGRGGVPNDGVEDGGDRSGGH